MRTGSNDQTLWLSELKDQASFSQGSNMSAGVTFLFSADIQGTLINVAEIIPGSMQSREKTSISTKSPLLWLIFMLLALAQTAFSFFLTIWINSSQTFPVRESSFQLVMLTALWGAEPRWAPSSLSATPQPSRRAECHSFPQHHRHFNKTFIITSLFPSLTFMLCWEFWSK